MSLNGLFLSFSALCDLKNTFFFEKKSKFFLKKNFFPNFSNSCSLNIFEPKIWRRLGTFPSCFFVRLQSHSDWATFLTIEATKTTSIRGQVRSAEISAKGSPFHFLPFLRNLQNRKRPKGPPFQFFFGTVRNFF